jgi:uncharacterized protein YdeI (YjbR/CyaY-like superfamily)
MKPRFFATPAAFRKWLAAHHGKADELLVGFRTRESGAPSITWPQAVDEALCFGWIDGVRQRLDAESYSIRFTPRRAGSTWSAVNIRRAEALREEGRLRAPGLRALAQRREKASRTYSYEQQAEPELDAALARSFRADRKAWNFFQSQAPSYRRKCIHWVMAARKSEIRQARLKRLIAAFSRGKRL